MLAEKNWILTQAVMYTLKTAIKIVSVAKEVVTEVVSLKKFRLISEEATSGTPFIRKRAVTRFCHSPF